MVSSSDFLVDERFDFGYGVVELNSKVDPISLQSTAARKIQYKSAISAAIASGTTRVFVHDVRLRLIWNISEERRYETHLVADIDNVLKPMIDALTGPDGILIDDNQVQAIDVSWRSILWDDKGFELRIESLSPDEYLVRGGRFIEIRPNRCFYFPPMRSDHEAAMANSLNRIFEAMEAAISSGAPQEEVMMMKPLSRPFPRARLAKFEVVGLDEVCVEEGTDQLS